VIDKSVEEYIKRNEGLRLKPYRCSANKWTIGFGRNIEDNGISEIEAEFLLSSDIRSVTEEIRRLIPDFDSLELPQKTALIDMGFNLGITRLSKFKKMLKAVNARDFKTAAEELLDSNYANQLPHRSSKNAELILKSRRKPSSYSV
jgi:lysozyme